MESPESHRIAASLTLRAAKGASVGQIADTIISIWRATDAALAPILGQAGVAALYRRSLYLAGPAHAWLLGTHDGIQTDADLAALKAVLSQQTSDVAAAGGGAVLQTFYEVLTSLVGPSLTERLLRSAWATPFSDGFAQDISS